MAEVSVLRHLAARVDWEARTASQYVPAAYADDGFVHACTDDQLVEVASSRFAGRDDLVLLTLDQDVLGVEVVVEDLYGHGAFPHVYGPVDLAAVTSARPFPRDEDGGFDWWQGDRREQVARPATRSSEAVADLLVHLEARGFDGAPRHRGAEGGLRFTTYVPGVTSGFPVPTWLPTESALHSVGQLLRAAHDASRDLDTGHDWYAGSPPGEVVGHHDVGPGNVVWRDGLAVALVDWEFAEPGDGWADLVDAAVNIAGWVPEDRRRRAGFGDVPATVLVQALLDGYGGSATLAQLADATLVHLTEELRRVRELGEQGGVAPWAELAESGAGERLQATLDWHRGGRPSG